jgi:hypothetical protein
MPRYPFAAMRRRSGLMSLIASDPEFETAQMTGSALAIAGFGPGNDRNHRHRVSTVLEMGFNPAIRGSKLTAWLP